jgi:NAD(P)-dependent dehydrogenase (short-subunit alcohol dehydrogenase family)
VTGASRGLGQYCALAYAREGATVVVAARTEQASEKLPGTIFETAQLVESAGGRALPLVCNVADESSVKAAFQQVLDRFGRIDVLMTNAGIQPAGGIASIPPRHFELEFKVNVFGTFHCIRAALPSMIERRGGAIITISSGATRSGGHYSATKRAVEAMTIGLANELRDKSIAVNCLQPTLSIRTPGALFRRTPEQRLAYQGLSSESYEEAAILLALQTADSCTGAVFSDAAAIAKLGTPHDLERFKVLYPADWSAELV